MGQGRDLHGVHKNGEEFPGKLDLILLNFMRKTYVMAPDYWYYGNVRSREKELSHWAGYDESTLTNFMCSMHFLYIFRMSIKRRSEIWAIDLKEFKTIDSIGY